jgi:hypothetical protein
VTTRRTDPLSASAAADGSLLKDDEKRSDEHRDASYRLIAKQNQEEPRGENPGVHERSLPREYARGVAHLRVAA